MISIAMLNGGFDNRTSQSSGRSVILRKSSTVEIRTAAIHNVAGVDSEAALAHGDHQIAQTAERLADDGYAGQQGLMRKQGFERDGWGVELIKSALGLRTAEGRTTLSRTSIEAGTLTHNATPINS